MTRDRKPETRLTTSGRHPEENFGIVNPPVYHASTVLFPTLAKLEAAVKNPFKGVYYGRFGTPTTFALEEAVAQMEGGDNAIATSSGLAAITCALQAFLKSGDHLLMVDTVYEPTRKFCEMVLKKNGVEVTYYDPLIGGAIGDLIQDNTKVVFTESPGSLTFEVQDIPAIAKAANGAGALTICDNTWASPLFFNPLKHGVDVSIQAATKYIVGHADAMLGVIICTEKHFKKLKTMTVVLGNAAGPDDCYLAIRGLRTLSVRLKRHEENGYQLADWLAGRSEVDRILHPGREGCPGHDIWKRDFCGSTGLFSIILKPVSKEALTAMLDDLELFGMGFSWGGYESLVLPVDPGYCRSATSWPLREGDGPLLRIHAGLEDVNDLIDDLEAGFKRLNATA